ncbi:MULTISPECIES: hypothetical protein [Bacteria]|uniref:hypothetical protein n=1 Tax=Bacteria TaxID=2 RepID=UPI000621C3BD|nr:hypothetical protein [Leucobacter sp. Ag1]KKI20578.1 hypothetical protein XM48_07640 [Leucobacter sp. Ag1]
MLTYLRSTITLRRARRRALAAFADDLIGRPAGSSVAHLVRAQRAGEQARVAAVLARIESGTETMRDMAGSVTLPNGIRKRWGYLTDDEIDSLRRAQAY